jgi:hypothetical protein
MEASLTRLLGLGFSEVSDTEYEITEAGSRFLKEHGDVDMDTSLRIPPSEVITQLVKDSTTVVVPVLNEVDGVGKVIKEIEAEGYENILVVDGYSTDKTREIKPT